MDVRDRPAACPRVHHARAGISLTPADFRFALLRPRPLLAGLLARMVSLPVVAWLLLQRFALGPELALGMMVLACCPGEVALSISCTALASLLTMGTLSLIVWRRWRARSGSRMASRST